jgi:hypothetical protein
MTLKLTPEQTLLMQTFDSFEDLVQETCWSCEPNELRVARECADRGLLQIEGIPADGDHFEVVLTAKGISVARNLAAKRVAGEVIARARLPSVGRSGEYERNGSSVVAFFVTFAAVFVVYFPLAIVSQNVLAQVKPDLFLPFTWSDWSALALIGTVAGLVFGLWQAGVACYPKGNAAGKKLWWQ